MRFDGRGDHATGIDALQTHSFPFAAEALEVPPRNSILRADNGSVWPEYWSQLRRKLGQAVRLYAKKDNICRPHFFKGIGDCRPRHEISLTTSHLHPALLHGAKVWPARKEGDIESRPRHARADVCTDCSRPRDQESHG